MSSEHKFSVMEMLLRDRPMTGELKTAGSNELQKFVNVMVATEPRARPPAKQLLQVKYSRQLALTNGTHVFSTNFYLAKRLQKTKTVY
jgi:hypothetical protein